MALLSCPECGGHVSDQACSCPHCGYPVRGEIEDAVPVETEDYIEDAQVIPTTKRPSPWGPSFREVAQIHTSSPFPHGIDITTLSEAELGAIIDYIGAVLAVCETNRMGVAANNEASNAKGWLRGFTRRTAASYAQWKREAAKRGLADVEARFRAVSSRWTYATELPTWGLTKVLEVYGLPVWGLLCEVYPDLTTFSSEQ